jgi:hypothetical protein
VARGQGLEEEDDGVDEVLEHRLRHFHRLDLVDFVEAGENQENQAGLLRRRGAPSGMVVLEVEAVVHLRQKIRAEHRRVERRLAVLAQQTPADPQLVGPPVVGGDSGGVRHVEGQLEDRIGESPLEGRLSHGQWVLIQDEDRR